MRNVTENKVEEKLKGLEVESTRETMSKKKLICVNPFHTVKFFVLCQAFLQLTQLMTSGYMKGSISTIERRFGFSSQTSGLVAACNELGNTPLIIFVSYFGSRVHRPRVIGCGALLVSVAAFIISLPKFVLGVYEYDHSVLGMLNATDTCSLGQPNVSMLEQCTVQRASESQVALSLLLLGQTLLGIGTVPIQPFGLSYIDDFASKSNSPLYLGIIFAGTALGPTIAFLLGSAMLRIFVDIDNIQTEELHLTNTDPRWVGAWWLGFILTSTLVAIAAIPYFFFPRELPKEEEDPKMATTKSGNRNLLDELKGQPEDLTLWQFVKRFPVVLLRNLKNPIFVMVILALINLASMIAGLAVFLAKFLEWQFTLTASYANMLIGAIHLPVGMLGLLLGGFIMKKCRLSVKKSTVLCITCMSLCILFAIPLFFLGCPIRKVAGLDFSGSTGFVVQVSDCNRRCNCSSTVYNPVCGQDRVEYISPCHAGCSDLDYDAPNKEILKYTKCSCIIIKGALGSASPGNCPRKCSQFLILFMVFTCISALMASIANTPAFMLSLRSVISEDKCFAIGIQLLLVRVFAWLPVPVLYGRIIDSTCVLWQEKCQKRAACRYYNSIALQKRYIGMQVWFEIWCLFCFVVVYYLYRKEERSLQAQTERVSLDEAPETESNALDSFFIQEEEPDPTGKP